MQKRLAPAALRGTRLGEHRVDLHQLFGLHAGVVMRALRTIGAVLRTAAGLDRQQSRDLHLVRIEVHAVDALGVEHQIGKRQREQRRDLRARPVMADDAVEAAHGRSSCRVRNGAIIHGARMAGGGANARRRAGGAEGNCPHWSGPLVPPPRCTLGRAVIGRRVKPRDDGALRGGYSAACARLDALHPGRAILELGDLAERIERRIGQEVGRRLDIGERDEHHAVGDRVVLARRELDGAAAGRDPHEVAGRIPSRAIVAARQRGDRAGLERVEHGGAPRHRAGVPMLELPAGGEHHREFGVGHLVGRRQLRRHELGEAAGRGKPSPNTTSWPGLSGASDG